jgi:hypothetical protein
MEVHTRGMTSSKSALKNTPEAAVEVSEEADRQSGGK